MGGDGALHIIDYADSKGYVGGGSCDGGVRSTPRRLVQSAGCPRGNVGVGMEIRQFLHPRQARSSEARKSGRVHRIDAADKSRGIITPMGTAGTAGAAAGTAAGTARKTGTNVKGHSVLLRRVALCSDDSDGEEFETCGGGGRPIQDVVSQEVSDVHLERGSNKLKENACARSAIVRSAPKASDICQTASRHDDALEQESFLVDRPAFQDEPQAQNDSVVSKKTR